ncbi:unnamed protein product [Cunninghamella blakesleeana]
MFWSTEIAPTQKHYILASGSIQLSQATLNTDNIQPGKTQLKVISKGNEYILCTLSKDTVQEQKLDISFNEENDSDCILTVTGVNSISLIGNLIEEEDDDDDDYEYEEDEDDEGGGSMLQFRDPSDNRFLGGFELRHFGLEVDTELPGIPVDDIDLRKEEENEEDRSLHNNIIQGLINAMINSGDTYQNARAKAVKKLLKQQSKDKNKDKNKNKNKITKNKVKK